MTKVFPVIDLAATGENIVRLRKMRGLTVRDLQNWFGFEEPQAIYKWQKGKSLPTVDNLYALGALLDVPIEEILVPCRPKLHIVSNGQQEVSCCPPLFPGCFAKGRTISTRFHFFSRLPLRPESENRTRLRWKQLKDCHLARNI